MRPMSCGASLSTSCRTKKIQLNRRLHLWRLNGERGIWGELEGEFETAEIDRKVFGQKAWNILRRSCRYISSTAFNSGAVWLRLETILWMDCHWQRDSLSGTTQEIGHSLYYRIGHLIMGHTIDWWTYVCQWMEQALLRRGEIWAWGKYESGDSLSLG